MNFFYRYFLYPAEHPGHYNIINTVTYAIIAVISVYLIYKYIFKKRFGEEDFQSLFPYILLGIFYRLSVDYGYIKPSILTVTPGCYIIPFFLWLFFRKTSGKASIFIGYGLLLYWIILFPPHINMLFIPWLAITVSVLLIKKFWYRALVGQMTDAIFSTIDILKGYGEEHVVASFLIKINPFLFPIVKMAIASIIIYLLRNCEENLRNYLYTIIFILGYGPGSRAVFL